MRLFKKTAALVMVFMMLVTAMSSFTLASANAVVDKFEVKEFSVLNSTGGNTLAAGDVTVNVTLQRVKGDNNTDDVASVIAAVYSGSALVDVAAAKKEFSFYGTTHDYDLDLVIPAEIADPELKVFLWSGDMITPIAKSSDEAKVTGITVGGEAVAFDAATSDYTVNALASAPNQPEIVVEADGIVKATTTWSKNVATVTTDKETYTINYNKENPALTEIKYDYNNHDASLDYVDITTTHRVVRKPDERLADTTKSITEALGSDLSNGFANYVTQAWSNRTYWYFNNVPDEFVGLNIIPMNYDSYPAGMKSQWKITSNADTRIYFIVYAGEVISGATLVDSVDLQTEFSLVEIADVNISKPISEGTVRKLSTACKLYYIDLIVPDGQTTASIELKTRNNTDAVTAGGTSGYFPDIVMYEFLDEDDVITTETPLSVTNNTISVTDAEGAVKYPTYTMSGKVRLPVYEEAGTDGSGNTMYKIKGTNGDDAYGNYATRLDAHGYNYIQSIPDEVVGANVFLWFDTFANADKTQTQTMKFTINRDAVLYFSTTPEFAAKSGAVLMDEGMGVLGAGSSYNAIVTLKIDEATKNGKGNAYHDGALYKLELYVPEGQDSATFEVPLSWYASSHHPFAFIKAN